jgi:hypothetical protein
LGELGGVRHGRRTYARGRATSNFTARAKANLTLLFRRNPEIDGFQQAIFKPPQNPFDLVRAKEILDTS